MRANDLETTFYQGYSRSERTHGHYRWMRRMMSLQYPSINFATPEIPDRRMYARYSTVAFHTGDVEDISIPVVDDRSVSRRHPTCLAILALRISAWQPLAISHHLRIEHPLSQPQSRRLLRDGGLPKIAASAGLCAAQHLWKMTHCEAYEMLT